MNVYNIDYNNDKYTLQKQNKNGEFINVGKPFNSFEKADKYARKISNEKEDILMNDIPF